MRLRIWHKMIVGISIPSLITLMGGLLTYGYVNNTENRQGYVQIADDLKEHVLEVRRNEKNFLHTKNEEQLVNLQNAIAVLNKSINEVSPKTILEIGHEDFSELQGKILAYSGVISNLHSNYLEESRVMEMVRVAGREIEKTADSGTYGEDLSTSFVLNLRLLEKNYMLFRDRRSYTELDNGISRLGNITPFCIPCKPYVEAIAALIETYEKSGTLEKMMRDTGKEMELITGRIARNERERIGSFLRKTKQLLLIALILLCTIGPLFVYKTAAYIVAPINRLARITNKISEGEMQLRAPIREHDETYSLATSFNTMLDKLQLTHQSLEQSMELLSEKQAQLVDFEKRASLGLLVSGIAHELNNPLYNISLTAEAMKDGFEDLTKDELAEYIRDILSQSKRAHLIIDDLLEFARARKSTVMERLDIVRVVRDSFNLVANQLRMNNISLEQALSDKPMYITGNRSKLEQILVSIFTNAIQAMKSNGTLSVSIARDEDNGQVVLKIGDTGPGIPAEDIKNIFEPFFTTKPVGEGTGLGLSVCRSLVMEHRGQIDAESTPGEGTVFTIRFPLYREAAVRSGRGEPGSDDTTG